MFNHSQSWEFCVFLISAAKISTEEERNLSKDFIEHIDRLIRRDPARRGLIGSESRYGPLCSGHLLKAASHLAENAKHVALVTGFYISAGDPPAAETDGPLGTLLLAVALQALGVNVCVITDENCLGAVSATAKASDFPEDNVIVYPHDSSAWIEDFFTEGPGSLLTHLISIERAGPSHTPESIRDQSRETHPPVEEYTSTVAEQNHNRCHNMRGHVIDDHTADLHRLFEELPRYRPDARTIGVGDGANEIGMGSILWEDLHSRLEGEQAARIPCRIATDWTIVAGTSNWGGYALAASILLLREQVELMRDWDCRQQLQVLEHLVEHGPAVDGVTGRREATVDGLPFLTYIQPWDAIRRLLGLEA